MTLQTVAHQAPSVMGFSRQEYWSGLPFSIPGDLTDKRIELASPALARRSFSTAPPPLLTKIFSLKRLPHNEKKKRLSCSPGQQDCGDVREGPCSEEHLEKHMFKGV